jgi:hypothetical protein
MIYPYNFISGGTYTIFDELKLQINWQAIYDYYSDELDAIYDKIVYNNFFNKNLDVNNLIRQYNNVSINRFDRLKAIYIDENIISNNQRYFGEIKYINLIPVLKKASSKYPNFTGGLSPIPANEIPINLLYFKRKIDSEIFNINDYKFNSETNVKFFSDYNDFEITTDSMLVNYIQKSILNFETDDNIYTLNYKLNFTKNINITFENSATTNVNSIVLNNKNYISGDTVGIGFENLNNGILNGELIYSGLTISNIDLNYLDNFDFWTSVNGYLDSEVLNYKVIKKCDRFNPLTVFSLNRFGGLDTLVLYNLVSEIQTNTNDYDRYINVQNISRSELSDSYKFSLTLFKEFINIENKERYLDFLKSTTYFINYEGEVYSFLIDSQNIEENLKTGYFNFKINIQLFEYNKIQN